MKRVIEHLLPHSDLTEYVSFFVEPEHSEDVANQLYGVMGQFRYVTVEALKTFPDEVFDILYASSQGDMEMSETVASALMSITPANGELFTSSEAKQTLHYLDIEKWNKTSIDISDLNTSQILVNSTAPLTPKQTHLDSLSPEQQEFVVRLSNTLMSELELTGENVLTRDSHLIDTSEVDSWFDGLDLPEGSFSLQ